MIHLISWIWVLGFQFFAVVSVSAEVEYVCFLRFFFGDSTFRVFILLMRLNMRIYAGKLGVFVACV